MCVCKQQMAMNWALLFLAVILSQHQSSANSGVLGIRTSGDIRRNDKTWLDTFLSLQLNDPNRYRSNISSLGNLFGGIVQLDGGVTSGDRKLSNNLLSFRRQNNNGESDDVMLNIPTDEKRVNRETKDEDELDWTSINQQLDMAIPLFLKHLETLEIEYLQLPDMDETISVTPLLMTLDAGIHLENGIVYNVEGVQRLGDALMTYRDRAFLIRCNLSFSSVQFEYDFRLKVVGIEGYGRVIGTLYNIVVYMEMSIDITKLTLQLKDFRFVSFDNIHVELDHTRLLGTLSGFILSPITNLFKETITSSISNGLTDQMQLAVDDFNENDPLELKKFTKQLLSSLTGKKD